MPIFNPKTISKHLPKAIDIPPQHQAAITGWVEQIQSGRLAKLNEVEVQGAFTQQIMCKLLGYSALGEAEHYSIAREYPVARGKVDLALGHFCGDKTQDVVLAPFELKGAKTQNLDAIMPGRHKTPVQQAFEYAKDIKGCKWVLLSNYLELRLYAISETSLHYECFKLEQLTQPEYYAKLQLLLHADNFLTGKTEALLKESANADKDISDKLYDDYKLLRENMLSYLIQDNPSYSAKALIAPTQKLLDRILFISFAEDKGLIPDTSIKKAFEHNDPYHPRPIYQNFIGLFNAIDKGNQALNIPAYNGGLFAKDEQLDNLTVSDALCEGFKNLAEYDFDSEVSVTVIGRIFEQSIADLEELTQAVEQGQLPKPKSKAKAVSGKRKKHGVVYTPDSITQFIVANTLGAHINAQFDTLFSEYGQYKSDNTVQWKKGNKTEQRFWYAWQETLQTIKVVDPACGSGAFMVAAFDYLYNEYEKTNEKLAELTGQRGILDLNKEILNNNLFGVDINDESIEITKLSLWLKTAERGKPLESLDDNFIAGNSLGFNTPVPGSSFCWQQAFPAIFANGGFDVVLGNPPYVRQELFSDIKPWLCENYAVYHGVLDLYGYFFELGAKLLKSNGRMAYISSATFFKTGSGAMLRTFLSENTTVEKIIDFGDVQVFEGVTTYPAILTFKNSQANASHAIDIFTVKDSLPENLQQTFEQAKGYMRQTHLGKGSWHLQDERLMAIKLKLTSGNPTIKQCYGSPNYGIKTGCNDAFVIDKATRDNIVECDPKSADIIRPFLEGKDLKKWHNRDRFLSVILMPKGWTREKMGIKPSDSLSEQEAWSWLSSTYPAITNWLEPFTQRGKKRGDKGEFWWELRACAYYDKFEKPKIQYGHFSPEPLFHYNTNQAYSNDKSYIIPTDDTFLYGLLNSNCYWFLIKSSCPFVRGGFYEVRAQYIEKLPVPAKPENEQISELAINIQTKAEACFKHENRFKRRLADLCPESQTFKLNKKLENWWQLDFKQLEKEIKKAFKGQLPSAPKERDDWQDYFEEMQQTQQRLQGEIKQLEQTLNQQVYQLFNLTPEEIHLIEAETKRWAKAVKV